jgi:hypothetical protein
MGVEGAPLVRFQPDLPDPDPVVFEPERVPEIMVRRRLAELMGILGSIERPLFDDVLLWRHQFTR